MVLPMPVAWTAPPSTAPVQACLTLSRSPLHTSPALDSPVAVHNMSTARTLHHSLQMLLAFLFLMKISEGTIIRSLIRNNLAGPDINFQDTPWPFDPDAGPRRSIEYQKLYGPLGRDKIESIGLGEDGLTEERRAQQQYRDSIGALTYQVPGYDNTIPA